MLHLGRQVQGLELGEMARHCTNGQSVHSLARCQPWASRSIVFASRVSLADVAVSRRVSAGETRPASRSRRQTMTTLGLSWTRFGGPSPARLHHALTSRVMRGFASIVLFEPGPCRAQECKGVTTRSALPEALWCSRPRPRFLDRICQGRYY